MNKRRLVLVNKAEARDALKNNEAFVRRLGESQCEAVIFPLAAFASGKNRTKLAVLAEVARQHGITVEAGGWDLSSLVPRRYFFFYKDSFRMVGGKRKKDHHFCPTSLDAIGIMRKEGKKLFQAATGIDVFHLWPDKGAEAAWCSCPTCRAFTAEEQARIAVNTAADILALINPNASITYFEAPVDNCNISLRKSIIKLDSVDENLYMENLAK